MLKMLLNCHQLLLQLHKQLLNIALGVFYGLKLHFKYSLLKILILAFNFVHLLLVAVNKVINLINFLYDLILLLLCILNLRKPQRKRVLIQNLVLHRHILPLDLTIL